MQTFNFGSQKQVLCYDFFALISCVFRLVEALLARRGLKAGLDLMGCLPACRIIVRKILCG
jgi:hypothetical protein